MIKRFFSKSIFIAVIVGLLFIFCGTGFARDGEKRGPHIEGGESGAEFMKLFDLNGDGKISHDEWETVKPNTVYREKHWPAYNVKRDGFIRLDEVPLKENGSEPAPAEEEKFSVTPKQIAFISKYDKDKDLKVSNKEFTGTNFSTYDKNNDGFIDLTEAPKY